MSFDLFFQNAVALHQAGKLDEAEQSYRQLLEIAPEHTDLLHLLGMIALQKGAFDSALDFLYKAVKLAPDAAAYRFTLAQALQSGGKPKEALEQYGEVARLDADLPDTDNNVGVIYRSLGQGKQARKAFESALQKKPDFALAMMNLALLERDEGHTDAALALLEKARSIDPQDAEIHAQTAITLRRTGQYEAALNQMNQAVALAPENPTYLNGLGIIKEALNDSDGAFDAYDAAIRIAPDYPDAYNNRAHIYAKRGRKWDAEDDYKTAVKLDPKFAEAFNDLGALLYDNERYEEALECYRKAFIINPKQAETCFNLGLAVKEAGDPAESVGLYLTALALKPDFAQVHHCLAQALHALYVHENKPDLAKRLAQKWLQFFPNNPIARRVCDAFENKNPAEFSPEYVRDLFDAFADSFESSLKKLDYRVPDLLKAALADEKSGLRVLDAGCGTGLNGAFLKTLAKPLTGIDLSSEMIEKAREKNLYDTLETADAVDYMNSHSAAFDLIVLADVACYFGDLTPLLTSAANGLDDGGKLFLTVEENLDGQTFALQPTGRYTHGESAVRDALNRAGLRMVSLTRDTLRTEDSAPVAGLVVLARKEKTTKEN